MVLSVAPFSFADLTWGTYSSERKEGGVEREMVGWRKEEKKEKLCEKQGFAEHYITFISPPHLPSLLLSNISD